MAAALDTLSESSTLRERKSSGTNSVMPLATSAFSALLGCAGGGGVAVVDAYLDVALCGDECLHRFNPCPRSLVMITWLYLTSI
jgi:hypothetical protein